MTTSVLNKAQYKLAARHISRLVNRYDLKPAVTHQSAPPTLEGVDNNLQCKSLEYEAEGHVVYHDSFRDIEWLVVAPLTPGDITRCFCGLCHYD